MATVLGESGVWRALVARLNLQDHSISTPQELFVLLARLEADRPQLLDAHRTRTMRSVHELGARITAATAERGFIKRILSWFRVRALRNRIAALYEADSRYSGALDQSIERVRALINSPEFAGAEAELDVINRLRTLPESFVVFNDVRLQATRHIRFEGAILRGAQVDHVVLTPAGVFVIETKRWSEKFAKSGDFYDPFEQVSRSSYLCYDLLLESFGKTPVRSVIVSVGSLPEAPRDSYVKVVRPETLNDYIAGFRNVEFTPERFADLRAFFANLIMRGLGVPRTR